MIALPIKYVDYDGVEREEKFYFHLSYADLVRLELDDKNGFKAKMETLIKSENQKEIWKTLEEVVAWLPVRNLLMEKDSINLMRQRLTS